VNGHNLTTVVAAALGFVVGAISAKGLSDVLGLFALVTGLSVGFARYLAVLRGNSKKEIERATAYGFFYGLGASAMALFLFAVLRP